MEERENLAQTVERLTQEGATHMVGDQLFSTNKLFPIFDNRKIDPITLNTLSGLVDFLINNVDDFKISKIMCLVNGHDDVSVVSAMDPNKLFRDTVVDVNLMEAGNKFQFGVFMDHEEFCIKLKALFVNSPDQIKLLNYASKLTINNTITVLDDGVSQSAQLNRGMSGALKTSEVAPVTVALAPYRTFHDIEQPVSDFLFRMRVSSDKAPLCALFEADGGAWRRTAMNRIAEYLKTKKSDLIVLV